MGFEKFTGGGRSFTPKISISRNGLIGFNQGTRRRFSLEKYAVCTLYYDKEEGRIGFEFSKDKNAEGGINLRLRKFGADIAGKSFLSYYNIKPKDTTMYPAKEGHMENWIIIDLTDGEERKKKQKNSSSP